MSIAAEVTEITQDRFLGPKELADRIPGMTVSNLAQLRFKGVGPKYMKPSPKVVVYDWADAVAWLESTKRDGTAEGD